MNSGNILGKLVGYDTVSRNSNMDLMNFVSRLLSDHGIESTLIPNSDSSKANLFATVGPKDVGGVILSGHTDVVPVDNQAWTKPAFKLTRSDGKYFGRGTADMKGFVACAISAILNASSLPLKVPLHIALSYDEEIGCQGVGSLIKLLTDNPIRPVMCIVGEPTNLAVATGHKGKIALKARCIGREGHSALAPLAMNALHLGCDLISIIRETQKELKNNFACDEDYDIPYTTVHAARIAGGMALNIVPNICNVDFEIRNVAEDNPEEILSKIKARTDEIIEFAQKKAKEAAINFETSFSYPGLNTPHSSSVVQFVKSLAGTNRTIKVAFGTEGGLFSNLLDVPTVICGPGSMMQGHKPDEYVEISQIERCDHMLENLVYRLKDGLI